MDKEKISLNIEITSTYLNDERINGIERMIKDSIQNAVSKIDAKSAPVFIEILKITSVNIDK